MRELRTETEINAGADHVWRLLTDFESFPQWNPFIRTADGDCVPGARLRVRLQPQGGRAMTIRPTVRKVDAPREFRWLGHFGMPGIFDGEHIFKIEPLDGERVRFLHEERFTGVFVPLVLRLVGDATRRGFEAMNLALKERAEALP
jgi:hypothetical protein